MVDLLVTGGTVCTVNEQRDVITDGAVAVDDGRIVAVGPADQLEAEYDAGELIDAEGSAVLPGFITTHVHVADILLRGLGADRYLYDWLCNVKSATSVMKPDDHEVAAALYCTEAIRSGITTFVENVTGAGAGYVSGDGSTGVIDAKMGVYDRAGIRNVWAQAIVDRAPGEDFLAYYDRITATEPSATHVDRADSVMDTETALDRIEGLIEEYHGTAEGRQSVWPAPYEFGITTPEALSGSLELAERYDVMTTTHSSTTTAFEAAPNMTDIEYAHSCDYLDERTLLGHCIYATDRDLRLLGRTDTSVAHNVLTNLALGEDFAPVPEMISTGVTVAMGTDNASASDTVDMVNDMRFAAMVHKSNRMDPGVMTAEKVVEMATIDAARAIGRADDLGSIETGKLADLVVIDMDEPHLTPSPNVPSAVVYQAQGSDVETVVCNGEVVMDDRTVDPIEAAFPDLLDRADEAAESLAERAGIAHLRERPWTAVADR